MAEVLPVSPDTTLDDLSQEFEYWRKTRQHRSSIPESLWQKVLDLTKSYPKSKVAQQLKLNYSELKRRLDSLNGQQVTSSPSFVEIGLPAMDGKSQRTSSSCHLEVETVSGTRFRCIVHGDIPADLLPFCRSLLEQR